MNSARPVAPSRLAELLLDLLSEEHLPPLDRWFSRRSKSLGWTVALQKEIWDSLRRCLTRVYTLLPDNAGTPTAWAGLRLALRGRAAEWARLSTSAGGTSLARAGIPSWLASAFEDRVRRSQWSASDRARFLEAQETAAPVHVRFRFGPEGEDSRQRFLATHTVGRSDVEGVSHLATTVGLERGTDWEKGLVEIQDAASQLSLRLLELRPGQRVWDVCSGRGGKTLLAAGELRGKGALVATDVAPEKLKTLKERVRRSGWQNIRILEWDGNHSPDFGTEVTSRGGFDRVIVDAPCSASGTWRRDPDSRFRLTPEGLRELTILQARLLRLGWAALKPGGRLAYITCSWIPAENEEIVEAFLAETPAVVLGQEALGQPFFDANTMLVTVLEKSL